MINNADQPAYPRPAAEGSISPEAGHGEQTGLTKREKCAFIAMQGILTSTQTSEQWQETDVIVEAAYNIADAMLEKELSDDR